MRRVPFSICLGLLLMLSPVVSAQSGLHGEYFDDTSLMQLVDMRVDAKLDFTNWVSAPPGTAVQADGEFSERWTGYVSVPTSGSWTFTTKSNDGVRVWVDGQQIIDNWSLHAVTEDSASITLPAGWHSLRVEHFQSGGQMAMQLFFDGPGQSKVIIPTANLSVQPLGNLLPGVTAGADLLVIAPGNSIVLPSLSNDADGSIVDTLWVQVSGPASTLVNPSAKNLTVENMNQVGDYQYQVTVTDDNGDQASDIVKVSVVECAGGAPEPDGSLRPWHRLGFDFQGPGANEGGNPNPFRDYRLTVRFVHTSTGVVYHVPGFFEADGRPDLTGATGGTVWRTWFTPDRAGDWYYTVSFRTGTDVAVSLDPQAGTPTSFDGLSGCFEVMKALKTEPGFRADGRLGYTDEHYLRHMGSGKPYLKGGANSPENLLAYVDFDQTPNAMHSYGPHLGDWTAGDPTWKGGLGKSLIGGVNYLAGQGVNAMYFLTFNVAGDGNDVWMWTSSTERERFDVSKLAQWEVLFNHMDDMGVAQHVITQEQENDTGSKAIDNGSLGLERMLYYRELVARFGHHLGIVWNLGEENGNSTSQLQDFYDYITALDPYDHPVVVHSYPGDQDDVYGPLLDLDRLEGASLQSLTADLVHQQTLMWRSESQAHGRPWFVASDETGPSSDGVLPDNVDLQHDEPRKEILWGNLMAGGAGVEWYFGYDYPNNDLDCEDWSQREAMWEQTGHALSFFNEHLPFTEMEPNDELVTNSKAWCFAAEDDTYAVYLPKGGATWLDLGSSTRTFDVLWFDPRNGGDLLTGTVLEVEGPGWVNIGTHPGGAPGQDWAGLVQFKNLPPVVTDVLIGPNPYLGNSFFSLQINVADPNGLDDVESVAVHVISPNFAYLGAVQCPKLEPGIYGFYAPNAPPIPTGTWYFAGAVTDQGGEQDYLIKTLEAQ